MIYSTIRGDNLSNHKSYKYPIWTHRHRLLSPIYLYQGLRVKRQTLRLDEPLGERIGCTKFNAIDATNHLPTLKLLVLGDSAGAGVGVQHQDQAFLGNLIRELGQNKSLGQRYSSIDWQLQATSGHTSFDVLKRLYTMQSHSFDLVVISVGVNDTVKNVATSHWQDNIEQLITLLQRKFFVKHIVFTGLPPMQLMPALPKPLNHFVGYQAQRLDRALKQVIARQNAQQKQSVYHLPMNLDDQNVSTIKLFAEDGFHPSELTYQLLAKNVVELIEQL